MFVQKKFNDVGKSIEQAFIAGNAGKTLKTCLNWKIRRMSAVSPCYSDMNVRLQLGR